jgi:hypothetical protein
MPRFLENEAGDRFYQQEDGTLVPSPRETESIAAQAGRQLADLGSGIKYLYGDITDNQALMSEAERETAQRSRYFAGADERAPIRSFVGQALPAAATFPITGGASLVGQLATNMGLGAAESALDMGEGGSMGQRAIAGAGGGLLGDIGGRVLGRIWNTARGLTRDITRGRGVAASPSAQEAEDLGLSLLESQRMAQNSPEMRTMQRLEQGAEASMFSPGLQRAQQEANQAVYRDAALEAIGLPSGSFDDLGPDALREANNRLSQGFSNVASQAAESGPTQIGDELAERILNTRGQIKDLRARGRFQGLDDGVLSGTEWGIARRALASDAARAAADGKYELADDIFADVEELDRIIERNVGPEVLDEFARLREQYRVFKILSKQGVVKSDGDVSVRNLNRALQAGTGFGTTAQQGLQTTNEQSKRLIDLARVGARPELQPFRSSGTAENLSAQRVAGMALDPTQWLSLVGEAAAPVGVGITSRRGGRAVTGALTPGPIQARVGGNIAGRGMLDEVLYPFVGVDDERIR